MVVFKRIFRFLSTVIYALTLIYILIYAPRLFGYRENIILNDDVESLYSKYTIVFYHKAYKNNIDVNDLVTYQINDEILCGKVQSVSNDEYRISGNNVKYDNILGKNSNIIVHFGKFIIFVRENSILAIIIALSCVMIDIILSIKCCDKKKKKVLNYE